MREHVVRMFLTLNRPHHTKSVRMQDCICDDKDGGIMTIMMQKSFPPRPTQHHWHTDFLTAEEIEGQDPGLGIYSTCDSEETLS